MKPSNQIPAGTVAVTTCECARTTGSIDPACALCAGSGERTRPLSRQERRHAERKLRRGKARLEAPATTATVLSPDEVVAYPKL